MEPLNAPLAQPVGTVAIGVDLGSKVDHTAIVAAELARWSDGLTVPPPGSLLIPTPRMLDGYRVRFMERLTLGLRYPDIAERIADVVRNVKALEPPRIALYVDQTGLGNPVLDIIRDALKGEPVTIIGATFTHGDKLTMKHEGGLRIASVGKAWLVSRLQSLLQTNRLKLPPSSAYAAVMTRELLDYQIKVDPDGNDKYGAFSVGSHDDLATALGLAVLHDPKRFAAGTVTEAYPAIPRGLYATLPGKWKR